MDSQAFISSSSSSFLMKQLNDLRKSGQLCDVHLKGGNCDQNGVDEPGRLSPTVLIGAHKAVLASFSPFFRAMFTSMLLLSWFRCLIFIHPCR